MSSSALQISSSFLAGLKALFPESPQITRSPKDSILRSSWYIVASVAFSASNRPEGVVQVFEHALADLRLTCPGPSQAVAQSTITSTNAEANNNMNATADDTAAEMLLAQRIRDALFKSGLISGYPKVINSLIKLNENMPAHLRDTTIRRDTRISLAEYEASGTRLFSAFYGDQTASVNALLDTAYPDMGWFSRTIGYGLIYGQLTPISQLETSYTLVAALIAGDTPQQIGWHLECAQRGGASLEEVNAVREAAVRVATLAGVQWRHALPEVREVQ